jgi:NAD(P)-dependent dehydrogenase (short-subunit alcohol dehydrogenase family)
MNCELLIIDGTEDVRYIYHNTTDPMEIKMKTVLITGCSSGYGLATANYFLANGWKVIATMRTPCENIFSKSENLKITALDVTKPESIAAILEQNSHIDVLVNNAGVGLFGALEATPMETIREVFETNTFGMIAMTQAVIPKFRAQKSGIVINVTSSAVFTPMPLVAVYTASKMAIEGFTASLAFELKPFNIDVKLVQPGYGPTTSFASNGEKRMQGLIPESYVNFAQDVFTSFTQIQDYTKEVDVAEAVWKAANDQTGQLSFPAGLDALALSKRK